MGGFPFEQQLNKPKVVLINEPGKPPYTMLTKRLNDDFND
jgi:hypothetical protein